MLVSESSHYRPTNETIAAGDERAFYLHWHTWPSAERDEAKAEDDPTSEGHFHDIVLAFSEHGCPKKD